MDSFCDFTAASQVVATRHRRVPRYDDNTVITFAELLADQIGDIDHPLFSEWRHKPFRHFPDFPKAQIAPRSASIPSSDIGSSFGCKRK